MIRHDEVLPVRTRRRTHNYPFGGLYADSLGRSPYPVGKCTPKYKTNWLNTDGALLDSLAVARWIKAEFGAKSSVTAVFMTHAVINENNSVSAHALSSCAALTKITRLLITILTSQTGIHRARRPLTSL